MYIYNKYVEIRQKLCVFLSFLKRNTAVTKSSGTTRDNHRQQQKQQSHSQEKMSNDDETTTSKNPTSILKLSHRYVYTIRGCQVFG